MSALPERRCWRALRRHHEAVKTAALYSRLGSRNLDDFANRVLSAMRKQLGGRTETAPG